MARRIQLILSGTAVVGMSAQARPNVLVIMANDQGHNTVTSQFMPQTKARILDQGVTFASGYMSTVLCQPSRTQFMMGRYDRNTGVHNSGNKISDREVGIGQAMKAAGYHTTRVKHRSEGGPSWTEC